MGMKMKSLLGLTLIIASIALSVGCDKKKDKTRVSDRSRGSGWQGTGGNGSGGSAEWGAITTSGNFSEVLLGQFLRTEEEIGFVSGASNADTGIRFRGQIDTRSCQGTIGILVWDSVAAEGNDPFYSEFQVTQCNGGSVLAEDSFGSIQFNGTATGGGVWSGTVTFDNGQRLGQFQINQCAIFGC